MMQGKDIVHEAFHETIPHLESVVARLQSEKTILHGNYDNRLARILVLEVALQEIESRAVPGGAIKDIARAALAEEPPDYAPLLGKALAECGHLKSIATCEHNVFPHPCGIVSCPSCGGDANER